ncbi:MAG: AarF/UbiB family protein [Acidobacteriota bacterium]
MGLIGRVGGAVQRAAIAARMRQLGMRMGRARTRAERDRIGGELVRLLRDARGLAMKIGQWTATAPEARALEPLMRLAARPEPLARVRRRLDASYGRPHPDLFETLAPAAGAASLAQVHRARLRPGFDDDARREVAVKLLGKGVRDAVQAELDLLGSLPFGMGARRAGFDLDAQRALFARVLAVELDLRREAEAQARLRAAMPPGVVVPRPRIDLCRRDVLVQTWEDGETLDVVAADWPDAQRAQAAARIVEAFLHGLLVAGCAQGDWNEGNVAFRRDEVGQDSGGDAVTLVLYDAGCLLELDADRRAGLRRAIARTRAARRSGDDVAFTAALIDDLIAAGVAPGPLRANASHIGPTVLALLGPLADPEPSPIGDGVAYRRRLRATLPDPYGRDVRAALPSDALLITRAVAGIVHLLRRLRAPVAWGTVFDGLG